MNTSKTLLSILVEELPKHGGWPDKTNVITQDSDGEVNTYNDAKNLRVNKFGTWCYTGYFNGFILPHLQGSCVASDYATAIITRDQYEAALAEGLPEKLEAQRTITSRANDDRLAQEIRILATNVTITGDVKLDAPQGLNIKGDLNECIGQPAEDLSPLVLQLIATMQDAQVSLSLNDAFELAETLVDAGYRKQ